MLRGATTNISIEDMKGCIQEWFGEIYCFEDLVEVYYSVRSEIDKQFVYIAEQICKEKNAE